MTVTVCMLLRMLGCGITKHVMACCTDIISSTGKGFSVWVPGPDLMEISLFGAIHFLSVEAKTDWTKATLADHM